MKHHLLAHLQNMYPFYGFRIDEIHKMDIIAYDWFGDNMLINMKEYINDYDENRPNDEMSFGISIVDSLVKISLYGHIEIWSNEMACFFYDNVCYTRIFKYTEIETDLTNKIENAINNLLLEIDKINEIRNNVINTYCMKK